MSIHHCAIHRDGGEGSRRLKSILPTLTDNLKAPWQCIIRISDRDKRMTKLHRSVAFHHEPTSYRSQHAHPEGQLFMLTLGTATFTSAHSNWVLLPNSPCWVPPRVQHAVFSKGDLTGISLKIHPTVCRALPSEDAMLESSPVLPALLRRTVELNADELRLERLTETIQKNDGTFDGRISRAIAPARRRLRTLHQGSII
jgi:hypothetical protein